MPFSPKLFNIYLDERISKWQKQDITGIKLSKNQQLSNLLFADDQVVIADTEDNVQKAAHKLNQIISEYGLTISVKKIGKAVPLQAWRGPEGSRKLRFPDFMTAQDGGKVSLTHRPPLPPGNTPGTHFC